MNTLKYQNVIFLLSLENISLLSAQYYGEVSYCTFMFLTFLYTGNALFLVLEGSYVEGCLFHSHLVCKAVGCADKND